MHEFERKLFHSGDVKVSIITIVYNAVDKIESTLLSVLRQNYRNLEYIVVDGGSTDGTMDIINRYRNEIDILISEKDDGIYDAFNKGVLNATGDWVGIMNAGDSFVTENLLSEVFSSRCCYDNVDVVYGDAIAVDGNVETLCKASEDISDMELGPCYRQGASFVKREVHFKYLFDLSKKDQLGFALDYEQMYRMYKNGVRYLKLPLIVLKYELRGASTVSPFKITYYNYLITHEMKCGLFMKFILFYLTIVRGVKIVSNRYYTRLCK